MTTTKRLYGAAVEVAFDEPRGETQDQADSREWAALCLRELADKVDDAVDQARASRAELAVAAAGGVPPGCLLSIAEAVRAASERAAALADALELAVRSHERYRAYVRARADLEAAGG